MAADNDLTEELVTRAGRGDAAAWQELLHRYQARLRQMVAVRLDRRLAARLDPSDVVQEVLAEAHKRMADYSNRRSLPFYPWLRQLAWERLVKLHEKHLQAQRRSITREESLDLALGDRSAEMLADRLAAPGASPVEELVREEMRQRVQTALARLPAREREVLILRYVEQLSLSEIGHVMGVTEAAAKARQTRALQHLHRLLGQNFEGERR
jgi:RNA polymerase sigma-70 factor (ECF subfamily)